MVHAYWLIGREIVEVEQQARKRAAYGEQLMQALAARLTAQFGAGYSIRNLRRIRQFYLTYPAGSVLTASTSGTEIRPAVMAESALTAPSSKKRTALLSKSSRSATVERALFPPLLGWSQYLVLLLRQERRGREDHPARGRLPHPGRALPELSADGRGAPSRDRAKSRGGRAPHQAAGGHHPRRQDQAATEKTRKVVRRMNEELGLR